MFLLDSSKENYESDSSGTQLACFIDDKDRKQNKKEQVKELQKKWSYKSIGTCDPAFI